MNKFVYAALALGGLTQAAGCVITTGGNAEMDVLWEVSGEFDYGDGCAELGATGVEVVTERLPSRDREIDVFNCSDGGVIISRRLGDYDVWVNAIDSQDRLLGQSEIVAVDLNSTDTIVELPALAFLNGQFEATWQLTDESSGSAVSCSDVGVGGISVLTTLSNSGGTGFDDIFDCPANADEGDIVTAELPLGTYSVDVSVLDAQTDEALSEPVIKEGTIENHATIVDLGVYEFLFN